MRLRSIYITLISLLIIKSSVAGRVDFIYSKYTASRGLACSQVSSILKDSRNNIWAATLAGLSKINSNGITNYTIKDGLPSNQIISLAEHINGDIWVGTTKGIGIIKGNRIYTPGLTRFNGLVSAILCTRAGDTWVAVSSNKQIIYKINLSGIITDSIKGLSWVRKFHLMNNHLIICTSKGVKLYDQGKLSTFTRGKSLIDSVFIQSVNSFGNRYYFCTKTGMMIWDKETQIMKKVLADHEVYDVAIMSGTIYCGTDKGLLILKEIRNMTYEIIETNLYGGLKNITEIVIDKENNLWIASALHGLLTGRENLTNNISFTPSVFTDNIYSFNYDEPCNQLVVGGQDKHTGNARFYSLKGTEIKSWMNNSDLPKSMITSFLHTSKNQHWITTFSEGIIVTDINGKIIRRYSDQALKHVPVQLYESRNGNIWTSTILNGIFKFKRDGSYTHYKINEKMKINFALAIHEDQYNNMWFGGTGLVCYRNNIFYNYTHQLGLSNVIVSKIIGWKNFLIISTLGKGIIAFRIAENGTIEERQEINVESGLSSNNVTDIAIDISGNLWATYVTGASCIKITELSDYKIVHFDKDDGLLDNNWENQGLEVIGDSVYIANSEGIVLTVPEKMLAKRTRYYLKPDILGVHLINSDDSYIKTYAFKDGDLPGNLKLPYNYNALSFEYVTNSFYHSRETYYQYKLEGYDVDWNTPTKSTSVNYMNLPPGNYTFLVRAFKGIKPLDVSENTTYSFVIQKPFWQKKWFNIGIILLLPASTFAYFRYRVSRIRNKEKQKTLINKKLADLELRALRAQLNPHFVFNALNSIQRYIISNDNETAYKYLGKFAKLLRRVLDSSANSIISLSEEIELIRLYIEIESLRFDNEFSYSIHIDKEIDMSSILVPSMILQPYVENAIKHGLMAKEGKRTLMIRIISNQHLVTVIIEDNGIGRTKAALQKDTDFLYKSKGISLSADRLSILKQFNSSGTDITIEDLYDENNLPVGTRVIFSLPKTINFN